MLFNEYETGGMEAVKLALYHLNINGHGAFCSGSEHQKFMLNAGFEKVNIFEGKFDHSMIVAFK